MIAALLMGGVVFLGYPQKQPTQASVGPVGEALAAKFQDLSQNGGLGKYLIKTRGFTGEQVTQVWNLSDGCGGDEEHHH